VTSDICKNRLPGAATFGFAPLGQRRVLRGTNEVVGQETLAPQGRALPDPVTAATRAFREQKSSCQPRSG